MPHAIFSTFNIIHRRDILPNNRLAIFDDLENITTFYNSDLVQKSWTCYSYLVIHEPKMAFLLCYFHPKVQEWHLSQTYYIPRAVILSLQSQYYWLGQGSILPWTSRHISQSEIPLEKWIVAHGQNTGCKYAILKGWIVIFLEYSRAPKNNSSNYSWWSDRCYCRIDKIVLCYSINMDLYGTGNVRSPHCDIIQWLPLSPNDRPW